MIGSGIKYFRKKKRIKQKVFAQKMETSDSYLCLVEKNKKYPSFEFVKKASKLLRIPIPVLFWFGMEVKDFKNKPMARVLKPKIDKMILTLIDRL